MLRIKWKKKSRSEEAKKNNQPLRNEKINSPGIEKAEMKNENREKLHREPKAGEAGNRPAEEEIYTK